MDISLCRRCFHFISGAHHSGLNFAQLFNGFSLNNSRDRACTQIFGYRIGPMPMPQIRAIEICTWVFTEHWVLVNVSTHLYLRPNFFDCKGSFHISAVFVLVGTVVMALGTLRSSKVLHAGMLKRVFRCPMSFFDTTPLGRIVNRFAKDVDTVDNMLPITLRTMLLCLFSVSYKNIAFHFVQLTSFPYFR
jgi:ABC-type multidrug transport system fused ATPase/permease subunit